MLRDDVSEADATEAAQVWSAGALKLGVSRLRWCPPLAQLWTVPAPFAAALCGYRASGAPNTSDNNDPQSKELGHELFTQLRVPPGKPETPDTGSALEREAWADLNTHRPDLAIRRSRLVADFAQYRHLAVLPAFSRKYRPVSKSFDELLGIAADIPSSPATTRLRRVLRNNATRYAMQDELTNQMLREMPEEAMLRVDLTVSSPATVPDPHMYVGVSAKWSLRTDRAQDCISQGARLAAQRRGAMPHFAVLTMEPRPAMLRILADGSGAIDCVYHLDLPALIRAIDVVASRKRGSWRPKQTFDRLLQQGRIRDYDDLVTAVQRIPAM